MFRPEEGSEGNRGSPLVPAMGIGEGITVQRRLWRAGPLVKIDLLYL